MNLKFMGFHEGCSESIVDKETIRDICRRIFVHSNRTSH